MTFVWRAALVMCIIFAGCLLGILLQHSVPSQHIADAKSAITTIQGLVALLLALVLGLLVWTSYGVYSQQQSEAHTLGSQVLQLDLALERYGPAADRGRELLRQELEASRVRFWGRDGGSEPVRLTWPVPRRVAPLRRFLRDAQARRRRAAPSAPYSPPTLGFNCANALSDVEAAQEPHSEGAAH